MDPSMYQDGEPDKTQELKKNMFLDFGSGNTKQQKFASLLASPDLNMLTMASPELEKMLASNGLLQTPTPTQFIYPDYVTDEQEAYARGFVEVLAAMHRGMPGGAGQAPPGKAATSSQDSTQTTLPSVQSNELPTYSQLMPKSAAFSSASTSAATTLANMSNFGSGPNAKRPYQFVPSGLVTPSKPFSTIPQPSGDVQVKNEPAPTCSTDLDHTVPTSMQGSPTPSSRVSDSPALSPSSSTINMDNDNMPIDMNDQEVIKVERKRARNRIAARKCRTRKLERIARLEEKVSELKNKNNELLQHATSLNDQVVQLKQQIMDHMKTGCQIMMPNVQSLSQT